jgi:hypothetical protein
MLQVTIKPVFYLTFQRYSMKCTCMRHQQTFEILASLPTSLHLCCSHLQDADISDMLYFKTAENESMKELKYPSYILFLDVILSAPYILY